MFLIALGPVSAKFAGALIFGVSPGWQGKENRRFLAAFEFQSASFARFFEAHPKLAAYYNFSLEALVFAQLLIMEDVSGRTDQFLTQWA